MKKLLLIVISLLVICLSLTACGNKNDETNDKTNVSTDTSEAANSGANEEENNKNDEYKVEDSIDTENSSGVMGTAYIKLPELASMRRGQGQIVDQSDDTLILMGGQHLETSLTTDSIDKVLNDFFAQPIDVLSKYRRVDYQDYKFKIDSAEEVKINDYQMCKYVGTHTYTYNGKNEQMNYVAYVAKLKSNNAYVYWIVMDESTEQNQNEVINTYATNIANSLYE